MWLSIVRTKEETDYLRESLSTPLSTKQENHIIGRLQQIQNFSKISKRENQNSGTVKMIFV